MEKEIREAGIELAKESISCKYVQDEGELKSCYEFGKDFAKLIK